MLALSLTVLAQQPRSADDPRNTAPTVGTGGPVGGPTGLFTVYDGQTLRKGEYTFSTAYSNFDRDPGNADFTEVPVSFQIGLTDYLEFFFNTDAYRGVKINSPRNVSGFYLPNSQIRIGGSLVSPPAIILAPQGTGASQFPNQGIFRPQGNQPFVSFPYTGGSAGSFGLQPPFFPPGPVFGFPTGTFPTLGPPRVGSGNGADLFPGVGAPVGGILPGIVFSTVCTVTTGCNNFTQAPVAFTNSPSYLPDAPFINRTYGESAFSTFSVGAKWRFTNVNSPYGIGIVAYYRFYADRATDAGGFNQLQRGASPGGNRGDIGLVLFGDVRLRKWLNVSANIGYNFNSSVKGNFPGRFTMLDRPDELIAAIGVDFPVNRYFQPILEFRALEYVGGRTPNAFENDPIDGIAGARFYPARWLSIGAAYRYHFNQQDAGFIRDTVSTFTVNVGDRTQTPPQTFTFRGTIPGFQPSSDAHGFIIQGTIGRRNKREAPQVLDKPADVTAVEFSKTVVTLPCPPGFRPAAGQDCGDQTVEVRTTAVDPENAVLTYNYTVSGGRIVGSGANVTWDLSGVRPGTYTITVGVDDGCGICGKTQTKTIEVKECVCEKICECPSSITVSGGGVVRPGEVLTFTANVVGGTQENITYNWTVSKGTIIEGQGTPVIRVSTEGLERTDIVARVEIGGLCPECPNTAQETGSVTERPGISPFDEFQVIPNDDIRGRLDNFFVALRNDPTATGYIVIDGPKKDADRREALIRNHIRFRKFDATRITIVRGDTSAPSVSTKLYVIPAGRSITEITR
ncbi:MAG: hypothetical protein D6687_11365 [Acidobacteria bacterium]|jgi:hypothetical protein|nr:MAG: hypothetical protein D6687_11365 [Acidobacteriota bacterium]